MINIAGSLEKTARSIAEEREIFFVETKPYCDGCKRQLHEDEPKHEVVRYRIGPVTYGDCCIAEARASIEGLRQ